MSLKKTNNITYPPYLLGNFVSCHNKKMTQMQLYALFYETCNSLKIVSEKASSIKINEYIVNKLNLGHEWNNTIIYIWDLQIFIRGFYLDDIKREYYFKQLNKYFRYHIKSQ